MRGMRRGKLHLLERLMGQKEKGERSESLDKFERRREKTSMLSAPESLVNT